MKTTVDLPDELLHRAKIVAAQRKTTLKELMVQGLDYATRAPIPDPLNERRERMAQFLAALQARNTEPVRPLSRDEIYNRHEGRWES